MWEAVLRWEPFIYLSVCYVGPLTHLIYTKNGVVRPHVTIELVSHSVSASPCGRIWFGSIIVLISELFKLYHIFCKVFICQDELSDVCLIDCNLHRLNFFIETFLRSKLICLLKLWWFNFVHGFHTSSKVSDPHVIVSWTIQKSSQSLGGLSISYTLFSINFGLINMALDLINIYHFWTPCDARLLWFFFDHLICSSELSFWQFHNTNNFNTVECFSSLKQFGSSYINASWFKIVENILPNIYMGFSNTFDCEHILNFWDLVRWQFNRMSSLDSIILLSFVRNGVLIFHEMSNWYYLRKSFRVLEHSVKIRLSLEYNIHFNIDYLFSSEQVYPRCLYKIWCDKNFNLHCCVQSG